MPDEAPLKVVDISTRKPYVQPEEAPLVPEPEHGGGRGGGTPPMDPSVSMKDHLDARDAALESRLLAKLDKLPSEGRMWGMVASVLGGMFVFFVAIIALLSFGGDRFDGGMSVSPAIAAAQQKQAGVDDKQDAQLSLMDDKLDILINQTADR